MLKSVWLTTIVLNLLNMSDNPLNICYEHICHMFGVQISTLCLYEPDGTERCIRINGRNAFLLPETTEKIKGEEFELKLKTGQTSEFGRLILHGIACRALSDEEKETVLAFSNFLYSEAMGGIIASYYPTVLSVRNLEVEYRNGAQVNKAVKKVSFDICRNEFTVLLGTSGCGKTSMLNAIGGMLTPSGGNILWNGKDIARMNDRERTAYRRDSVGFVFQHYNLITDLTAAENVRVAAALVKNPRSTHEVLEMVGLKDKGSRYPNQMSGGEQQRVCIARALVKRAEILLCDEPTGALDTGNAVAIMTILQEIVKSQGIPVMMITHNPTFSVLADHYFMMSNGSIVEEMRQPFPLKVESMTLR